MSNERLEKFKKRQSKSLKYEEMERENKEHDDSLVGGTPGVKELIDSASLKEAAAVFTLEGIQTFMHIFDKTINNVLDKALNEKLEKSMEKILERKLSEVLSGATEGLQRFIADSTMNLVEQKIEKKIDSIGETACTLEVVPKAPQERQYNHIMRIPTNTKRLDLGKETMNKYGPVVMDIVKRQTDRFAPSHIMKIMAEEQGMCWTHGTKIIRYLIDNGYPVKKVDRGEYIYMETGENFENEN